MKLGKRPRRDDPRTLFLSKYLLPGAPPPPPAKAYYEYLVKDWKMFGNDHIGDCTCASAGHLIMNWTAHTTSEAKLGDDEIIAAYSAVSGFDPFTGNGDNGAVELDVLNYWRKTGVAGHKITAYSALDVKNLTQVKQGIYLFGGIYIGVQLPVSAQRQEVWDVVDNDQGVWGGHAIPILGYGRDGFACITWGRIKYLTNDFWFRYVEEAYAILSPEWVDREGIAPNHVDLASLEADLPLL